CSRCRGQLFVERLTDLVCFGCGELSWADSATVVTIPAEPRRIRHATQRPSALAERVAPTQDKLVLRFVAGGLSREDAEDAAQETWMKCLAAERRGQAVRWPYIWTTARTVLIDYDRRLKAYGGARKTCPLEEAARAAGWAH